MTCDEDLSDLIVHVTSTEIIAWKAWADRFLLAHSISTPPLEYLDLLFWWMIQGDFMQRLRQRQKKKYQKAPKKSPKKHA
jgi:hypothetical protein